MFPTQIRSIALQILGIANNTTAVITPSIKSFFESVGVSIITTFVAACFLVMLFTMQISETLGKMAPEMIE